MKINPKFMKNADPQDVVIVLGVYVLIISIIVFLHWAAVWADQMSEREAQYTGLKDRNGTKINEGDVLVDDAGEPIEYWIVKFSDGGFVGECAGVAEPLFELTQLEVVGSIHEDSELLEEK